MGFGVWGLGFGVWGLGFGVWGLSALGGTSGVLVSGDAVSRDAHRAAGRLQLKRRNRL